MYQERCYPSTTWVMLFINGRGALPAQNKENLLGDIFSYHLSRENFEGLEQTRDYLSYNMTVTRFRCNSFRFLWRNLGFVAVTVDLTLERSSKESKLLLNLSSI